MLCDARGTRGAETRDEQRRASVAEQTRAERSEARARERRAEYANERREHARNTSLYSYTARRGKRASGKCLGKPTI